MNKTTTAILALTCAAIGLASSYVTGQFFILGIEKLEADVLARQALITSGILMIVVELAAFGLAALLPRAVLRGLRYKLVAIGLMLLAFEAVTIYATQSAMNSVATHEATATKNRASGIRASIESQQRAIQSLRAAGEKQTGSGNSWAQHLGTVALKDAIKAEQKLSDLTTELAAVEASIKPTLAGVLGDTGMTYYSVSRALLVSIMGLVMFGAAGALLREFQGVIATVDTGTITPAITAKPAPDYTRTGPVARFATGTAFALSALSPAAYATTAPMQKATPPAPPALPEADHFADTGKTIDARYERIKAGVKAGEIKPSVRGLMSAERMGTRAAGEYLERMGGEGLVSRARVGWVLV